MHALLKRYSINLKKATQTELSRKWSPVTGVAYLAPRQTSGKHRLVSVGLVT